MSRRTTRKVPERSSGTFRSSIRSENVPVPPPMPRTALRTASLALLSAAAVALVPGAAQAATVGPPEVLRAGQKLPIDFTTGLRRGRPIPRGHEVISRTVALGPRETAELTMRCRSTAPRIRTLGFPDPSALGFLLVAPRPYAGRRQVRIRVYLAPDVREEGGRGVAYVVCRKRGR